MTDQKPPMFRIFTLDGATVSCSRALSEGEARDRLTGISDSRAPVCVTEREIKSWIDGDYGSPPLKRMAELACGYAYQARLAAGDRLT